MGPMWEALTLTNQRLNDGQPELVYWRYVDTYIKDVPSYGWYNIRNSIISIFSLMATNILRLPSKTSIIQA